MAKQKYWPPLLQVQGTTLLGSRYVTLAAAVVVCIAAVPPPSAATTLPHFCDVGYHYAANGTFHVNQRVPRRHHQRLRLRRLRRGGIPGRAAGLPAGHGRHRLPRRLRPPLRQLPVRRLSETGPVARLGIDVSIYIWTTNPKLAFL